jgi:hypothetical protein
MAPLRLVGGIFIDWGDTGFCDGSHDISGVIAVQYTQLNYRSLSVGAVLVVLLVFAGKSAFSEGVSARGKPDPLLTDNPSGACAPELDRADVVNGTDVDGQAVAPANLASGPIPLRGQIEVPLRARGGRPPVYVAVDGAKLDPLLNPRSACK